MRVLVVVLLASACATGPVLLPAAPMPGTVVQAGVAPSVTGGGALPFSPQLGVTQTPVSGVGGGGAAFVDVQPYPEVHLIASGHGAYLRAFDGSSHGMVYGGRAGGRWVKPLLGNTTFVGADAMVGYLGTTGFSGPSTQHFVLAQVGLPVAEAAPVPGLYVYTEPIVGIAVPLHAGAATPFTGVFEWPIGISWEAQPWLVLVAEGGVAQPTVGPYGAVGVALRL